MARSDAAPEADEGVVEGVIAHTAAPASGNSPHADDSGYQPREDLVSEERPLPGSDTKTVVQVAPPNDKGEPNEVFVDEDVYDEKPLPGSDRTTKVLRYAKGTRLVGDAAADYRERGGRKAKAKSD
jgi:hypothetical protein